MLQEPGNRPIDLVALSAVAGVVPTHTDDPASVPDLLDRVGAVVLSGAGTDESVAADIARRTLGDRLVAAARPIAVTDGGGKDRRLTEDAARRMLPLHTDGFAYGASAPDVFFLVCTTPSAGDGMSFLVDQLALLDALAECVAPGAELVDFVRSHVVDQTEPGAHPALGPIALPLPNGQAAVRRSITVRPADDDPDPARGASADLVAGTARRRRRARCRASGWRPVMRSPSTTRASRTAVMRTPPTIACSGAAGRGPIAPAEYPTASSGATRGCSSAIRRDTCSDRRSFIGS